MSRVGSGGAGRHLDAFAILSNIGAEEAAYLTARVVLDCSARKMRATATASAVANALIDHIELSELRQVRRDAFNGLVKANQKSRSHSAKKRRAIRKTMAEHGAHTEYDLKTRLRTGFHLINLLCDSTGLFVIDEDNQHGKWVRTTEAARRWLEDQHARCELLEPIHLPMIIPPRPWSSPFKGGYLTRSPGQRLVKQSYRPYHDDLAAHDMPAVYAAVNAIQNTAWRINQPVFAVMKEIWDNGGQLGGLPARDPRPIPATPDEFHYNEESKKQWKREAAGLHDLNNKDLSKRLAVSQRIWVAEKFADEDAIFFPHSLDFRGRVYPIPVGGPHPQGDDIAKALLEFADGYSIGDAGAGALAVHIAGLFGIDKVSTEERMDWFWANEPLILDSASNPLDGQRFWATADSPFMALAACMEWEGYCRDGASLCKSDVSQLGGAPTDPQRFDDRALRVSELDATTGSWTLHYMLDTQLSDAERYPLKTRDLIVWDVDPKRAPVAMSYGSSDEQQLDFVSPGFTGDRFYGPILKSVSEHWADYTGSVLHVDPAGSGSDETAYVVTKYLEGRIYVRAWGGFRDGTSEATLDALAELAKAEEVREVVIEDNFGDGLYRQMLQPFLHRRFSTRWRCGLSGIKVTKQKELRIIGALEPTLKQHRLVISKDVIKAQLGQGDYNGLYQMCRMTSARGAVKHDDRIDVLAQAVDHWKAFMNADILKSEANAQAKAAREFEKKFFANTPLARMFDTRPKRGQGRRLR
ncbi:hypothetical protein ABIB58_001031 [Brevundimonas sp. UYEF29]|uniref:phage terminase large subunit n=1 Tax=Brevundimonas sp. UYEF29 TaxID=3156346 RepID=UPI00339B3A45